MTPHQTILAALALAAAPTLLAAQPFQADIRRTAYGVPHIKAADFGGIGYGYGYASAQDNICEIADRIITVSGERAKHLGPGAGDANINSDLYHRRSNNRGEVERLLAGPAASIDTPSSDARALGRGYVAGVNRHLREVGGAAGITDPRCRGAAWVRPLTELDFWRHMFVGQTVDGAFAPVADARPPGPARTAALAPDIAGHETDVGSNAYGLGREVTKTGRGMLLGNPHYPWTGVNRFYRTHFIIPGRLNVVGISYVGMPMIRIGHTDKIAWSNTVSTASRFGYFELKLDPADPTRYLYEGRSEPMTRQLVTVEVKDAPPVTRTLYTTRYGPVVSTTTMPWTAERAFALRQAPVGLRDPDQYMAVWQSKSVRELRDALVKRQSYRFNTTAVDAGGEAFYGDMGLIPNVPEALAADCIVSDVGREAWAKQRRPVLDGSRAACDWKTDADSTAPGFFGGAAAPQLFRRDYVTQSNDSYWLTNPKAPLTGYSRVWGDEATARSLRTRLGLDQVQRRVAGTDGLAGRKFDLATLQQVMFGNRHLGAELARDDLVAACRRSGKPDLQPACEVLAKWDLKVDLDSKGAHLFHLFVENGGLTWRVPFDPADPVRTPRTLEVDPAGLAALEKAVARLAELGIPLDARWGDVQRDDRGKGELVPIHGGAGGHGVFNVITVGDPLKPGLGWTNIRHGASWVFAVEFTAKGPVSRGVLTYGQSTNSTSPHYADQTRLYSRKGWDDLLFTDAAVEAATLSRVTIRE